MAARSGLASSMIRWGMAVERTSPGPGRTPTNLGRVRWMICRQAGRNWSKNTKRGVSPSSMRCVRVSGATKRGSVLNTGSISSIVQGGGQG